MQDKDRGSGVGEGGRGQEVKAPTAAIRSRRSRWEVLSWTRGANLKSLRMLGMHSARQLSDSGARE